MKKKKRFIIGAVVMALIAVFLYLFFVKYGVMLL